MWSKNWTDKIGDWIYWWVTIRYSFSYYGSKEKLIFIRFKANALKGLLTRFGEQRYFVKEVVSFEFSTISPNGRDKYSSLHTFGESDC